MKLSFEIIKRFFKQRGGDWIILIFSLLLAFLMWSVLRLSQNYTTYFQYKVIVNSSLIGRIKQAVSVDPIVVRGRASGFYILQQKYFINEEIIEITVDPKLLRKSESKEDLFFLRNSDIKDKLHEVLDEKIRVESTNFDSLFFYFHRQSNKKVPIKCKSNLVYAKEYMPFTDVQLKPDSILIYGQTKVISAIDSIFTQEIKGVKLKRSISGLVELDPIDGVNFSTNEIYFSQEIGRYYENYFILPINVINNPSATLLINPKEVKIYYRALITDKKSYRASDFGVEINYNNLFTTTEGKNLAKVNVIKYPKNVRDVRIEPLFVEVF